MSEIEYTSDEIIRLTRDNHIMQKDIENLNKQIEDIEKAIHYPDCWDTMTYPTLLSAITEIHLCTTCLAEDQRVKESDGE